MKTTRLERDLFQAITRVEDLEQRYDLLTTQLPELLAKARAEERERCAKVCDEHARRCQKKAMDYKTLDARSYMTRHDTASSLAAQIRVLEDE